MTSDSKKWYVKLPMPKASMSVSRANSNNLTKRIEELEQATGVALATSQCGFVQFVSTQDQDYFPRATVDATLCRGIFKRTCEFYWLNLETRADGLWRIPYVKEEFWQLDAARRLGNTKKKLS